MVKPIPLYLLPDSVIYEEYEGDDRYGGAFKSPINIENVRVEELDSHEQSNIRDGQEYTHKLYFDVVNSTSSAVFNFVPKSKINYKNEVLIVQKVNPVKAFELHHYELELKS